MSALPNELNELSYLERARRIGLLAVDHVATLVEVAALELGEEKRRVIARIIAAAAAGLFGLLTIVFVAVAIIVAAWDTDYRTLVAFCVALFFAIGAIAGFVIMRSHGAAAPGGSFGTLRAELNKDLAMMRGQAAPMSAPTSDSDMRSPTSPL